MRGPAETALVVLEVKSSAWRGQTHRAIVDRRARHERNPRSVVTAKNRTPVDAGVIRGAVAAYRLCLAPVCRVNENGLSEIRCGPDKPRQCISIPLGCGRPYVRTTGQRAIIISLA